MRHTLRALVLAGAAAAFLSSPASANDVYPSRNITMIVPFAPGGFADTVARLVAPEMEKALQKPVVVENRSGTGAGIASAARADADGYTVLMALNSVTVIPESARASGQKPPYELSQLAPIALITADPSVFLVRPDAPWKTLAELIADARKRPGAISYASSGSFGVSHLTAEAAAKAAGAKLLHVPYRGGAPSMTALLSKDVDFTIQSPPVANQNIAAGNARALAVSTANRAKSMPGTPSLKEEGIDVDVPFWSALFVPAETPAPVRAKLLDALKQAMASDELRQKLAAAGTEVRFLHGAEFEKFLAKEAADMSALVKELSLKN